MISNYSKEEQATTITIQKDDELVEVLYRIIEMHFEKTYKMYDDEYKQLQNIMCNEETWQKLESIIKEIEENIHYIPELKERGLI